MSGAAISYLGTASLSPAAGRGTCRRPKALWLYRHQWPFPFQRTAGLNSLRHRRTSLDLATLNRTQVLLVLLRLVAQCPFHVAYECIKGLSRSSTVQAVAACCTESVHAYRTARLIPMATSVLILLLVTLAPQCIVALTHAVDSQQQLSTSQFGFQERNVKNFQFDSIDLLAGLANITDIEKRALVCPAGSMPVCYPDSILSRRRILTKCSVLTASTAQPQVASAAQVTMPTAVT